MEEQERQSGSKKKRKPRLTPGKLTDLYIDCCGISHAVAEKFFNATGQSVSPKEVMTLATRYCGPEAQDMGAAMLYDLCLWGIRKGINEDGNPRTIDLGIREAEKARNKAFRKDVLKRLKDREISVAEAAIEFDIAGVKIPDSVKIMLAKEEPSAVDPTGGAYSEFSPEDFDKRVAERFGEIGGQVEGLPQRREEMRKLREEVADAFAPEVDDSDGEAQSDLE